ncbi:MAG: hypothetical protein HQK97_02605 [Nitrospirae bacterium]|nr:hypothetical protein [Nitrospirota bacterium]
MYQDFKELLAILNAEHVKYLVVGGYAVSLHAQPRATKDLDILIKPDKANVEALFRALSKFGAPIEGLKPDDFAESGSFFRMGTPPVMVDILPEITGVDFDNAWQRRAMGTIDAKTNLQAAFISADDLIAAKEAAGRPQDLADAVALRKAQSTPKTDPKPKPTRRAKKTPPKP